MNCIHLHNPFILYRTVHVHVYATADFDSISWNQFRALCSIISRIIPWYRHQGCRQESCSKSLEACHSRSVLSVWKTGDSLNIESVGIGRIGLYSVPFPPGPGRDICKTQFYRVLTSSACVLTSLPGDCETKYKVDQIVKHYCGQDWCVFLK